MVAKTLSNLLALVLLVIAANSAATPPKQRVEIANGGFVVNGAAFFPVGFYYIWEMSAPVIGGYPPRTDVRTNTSVWKTGDDFWKDYYATGFNTFTQGWCGSGRDQGYGQMLDYLQKELGTGILPILNVGNTQQVYHGTNAQAKADQAGILAKNFANESFLAYCKHGRPAERRPQWDATAVLSSFDFALPLCSLQLHRRADYTHGICRTADVFDEVGPAAMGMDEAVTKAVVGNDTYHPTFSLVCGVQCQGRANGLNSRNYAARHPIVAVDSYTVSAHGTHLSPSSPTHPPLSLSCRHFSLVAAYLPAVPATGVPEKCDRVADFCSSGHRPSAPHPCQQWAAAVGCLASDLPFC